MEKTKGKITDEELLRYTWGALSLTGLERATFRNYYSDRRENLRQYSRDVVEIDKTIKKKFDFLKP